MERSFMLWVLGVVLSGCPMPAPDFCAPSSTRCAPDGVPETCSQTQRWTRIRPTEPCPAPSVCCPRLVPSGRLAHGCYPLAACAADGGL